MRRPGNGSARDPLRQGTGDPVESPQTGSGLVELMTGLLAAGITTVVKADAERERRPWTVVTSGGAKG